jgi:Zn-finger nucleic acid-binding protein
MNPKPIEPIACAGCERTFHPAMKACPFCGAERVEPVHDAAVACPLCRCPLDETEFRGEAVDVCPKCDGLWLDKAQFARLTSARDALLDGNVPYAYGKGPMETRTAYLPCPRCGGLMVRQNFRGVSGVVIDWCGDHGAWFDKDELQRIRAFVANGGIDRAQDREIAHTQEDVSGLKGRVADLEMMEKILHKWKIGRIRYRGL